MSRLKVSFNAPLNQLDTEIQTFGCRQNNPDICGYNGVPGVCTFVCIDRICRKPSRSWKKKYKDLKEAESYE